MVCPRSAAFQQNTMFGGTSSRESVDILNRPFAITQPKPTRKHRSEGRAPASPWIFRIDPFAIVQPKPNRKTPFRGTSSRESVENSFVDSRELVPPILNGTSDS